jgi:DNA-binding NtrC family response regulator
MLAELTDWYFYDGSATKRGLPPLVAHVPHRILLIDDDSMALFVMAEVVRRRLPAVTIDLAPNPGVTFILLASANYDVIVSEIRLPGMNGIDLLKTIKGIRPESMVVLVSCEASLRDEAMQHGATGFVKKPIVIEQFVSVLMKSLEQARLHQILRDRNRHSVLQDTVRRAGS